MPTTATIDRDQRDGIYEVVRNHLGAIGDVWIALEENEDFEVAERLGREFGEDFRLLADIGWSPEEERRAFALTMPALDLIALLDRLSEEAERVLLGAAAEREAERADAATRSRFQLGLDACEELLVDLDEAGRGKHERRQAQAPWPRRA